MLGFRNGLYGDGRISYHEFISVRGWVRVRVSVRVRVRVRVRVSVSVSVRACLLYTSPSPRDS